MNEKNKYDEAAREQIEEMAHELCGMNSSCEVCRLDKLCLARNSADILYNAGYRKQSEGEWRVQSVGRADCFVFFFKLCSECNYCYKSTSPTGYKYCPNCGAKMKGGE